jgi:hypothetical protein
MTTKKKIIIKLQGSKNELKKLFCKHKERKKEARIYLYMKQKTEKKNVGRRFPKEEDLKC